MTTAAALVTLGLAFTAPASRLAPPRVSSARMMCAAVMPETPPALESDCGFDHVPLSIALQSGDFLEARPPGPPATTHTACPRHTSVREGETMRVPPAKNNSKATLGDTQQYEQHRLAPASRA